ncbi:MAG: hypothetical protein A2X67_05795 [Ignavibacteria bacterium GWA2_55_11]|nr:MAG: hypothetical protein A2X67_05795 [Ignavibacteria bacterium GWA2_55_11]
MNTHSDYRDDSIMKTRWIRTTCIVLWLVLVEQGFAQWKPVAGVDGDVLYLSANGPTLAAQSTVGFYFSSDNGISWEQANSTFANSFLASFPYDSTNYLIGAETGHMVVLPSGSNLETASIELSAFLTVVASASILTPNTSMEGFRVTVDSGTTAYTLSDILSSLALYASGLDTSFILSGVQTALLAISMDGGEHWMTVQDILSSVSVRSVESTGAFVFVGTNRGVFRASANGSDWTEVNNGLTDTDVHALVRSNESLFAATEAGVFLSTDEGITWNATNSGLTNLSVRALVVYEGDVFAGTQDGVFVSAANVISWTAENEGLTSTWVNALAVSGINLFAGTSGSGLWLRPLSEMITTDVRIPHELPLRLELHQNYPNPFNPSTTIEYDLPTPSHIVLKMFNIAGQEVAVLADTDEGPGVKRIVWTANVPSGFYVCRLEATTLVGLEKRTIATKKMVLLK